MAKPIKRVAVTGVDTTSCFFVHVVPELESDLTEIEGASFIKSSDGSYTVMVNPLYDKAEVLREIEALGSVPQAFLDA